MTIRSISPAAACDILANGAVLIDIREPDEHRRMRIPGAQNIPVSRLGQQDGPVPVIYHCRSGMRTSGNAARLAGLSKCPAYLLDGGIEAWRAAGMPIEQDARAPLEIMRQVQIAAGFLILAGVVLSLTVAPAAIALSGFVGAGLMFAGISGWCGMAKLLALMPWNRPRAA